MMITNETGWSLGAQSHSFQERGVLDMLGHSLKKVYGDPSDDDLPPNLRELVAQLERAERNMMRAIDR